MLNQLTPKRLFLFDGLGALITFVMLRLVLARFEPVFGMPREFLNPLAGVAFVFAVYSLSCYFFLKRAPYPYLRLIAIANTVYCVITFGLVIYLFEIVTWLGIAYFLGEIGIVMTLVRFEWKNSFHRKINQ